MYFQQHEMKFEASPTSPDISSGMSALKSKLPLMNFMLYSITIAVVALAPSTISEAPATFAVKWEKKDRRRLYARLRPAILSKVVYSRWLSENLLWR